MTIKPHLLIANSTLLAQLEHDAINIEIKKSTGAVDPIEASAFKMVTLDEMSQAISKLLPESDLHYDLINFNIHYYFLACGLESSDYEWSVIKKDAEGEKVALGKHFTGKLSTAEGFIYTVKDDLLTEEQKPDIPYAELKSKALLSVMRYATEAFDKQVGLILNQHRAWELDYIYDITLTYKFDPKITKTVSNVFDLKDTKDVEHAVNQLHAKLVKKIVKKACTLKITVDIDRDDFGNDDEPSDFYKSPMKHIEKGFYDEYGISFIFLEDRALAEIDITNNQKLFIGSYNYNIDRKELTFSVDPNRVPYFQDIYDATSKPLISSMEAFLEDFGNNGWIVMRDLMAKKPMQEWDKLVVSAFWTALMDGVGCVSYQKSQFQK